ncbi:chromosome partitioning protein ParB, partial [Pseudomonas sp. FW305-130]
ASAAEGGELASELGDDQPQRTVISIGAAAVSPADEEDEQEDMLKPLPDRLVTELTTHRTLALRDAVAAHPTVAFAAVLHAFVLETFY